jgi:hypothetical protein
MVMELQARADMMFTRPPPRELFADIARSKNSERLRHLPENKEQQLPHIEHDCRMTIDCECAHLSHVLPLSVFCNIVTRYTVVAHPNPPPAVMPVAAAPAAAKRLGDNLPLPVQSAYPALGGSASATTVARR